MAVKILDTVLISSESGLKLFQNHPIVRKSTELVRFKSEAAIKESKRTVLDADEVLMEES